jgi:hypothetical protein
MSAYLLIELAIEYRGLGNTPQYVDLNTITPPPPDRGLWVEVRQPLRIQCDSVQVVRDPLEAALFGKVESTYFKAQVIGSDRWLIIDHDGVATCAEVAKSPQVGVLEQLDPRFRGTLEGYGLTVPVVGTVMRLQLSWQPTRIKRYCYYAGMFGLLSLYLAGHFWRKHLQAVRARNGSSIGMRELLKRLRNVAPLRALTPVLHQFRSYSWRLELGSSRGSG